MGKSYSINIEIGDASFVTDLNEDQIEHMRKELEESIRKTFITRISYGVKDIKIVFNKK